MAPKIFLTGDPGCGKTTVVRRVVERLRPTVPMSGFVTEEVRVGGRRIGFRGRTVSGETFDLAMVGGQGPVRIGPYTVALEGIDAVGVPSLAPRPGIRLIVLDEVGKMESFSPAFREAVERLLGDETPLLATVAAHGVGFVKRVRSDPRITLVGMRREGRDAVVGEILRLLSDAGLGSGTGSRDARGSRRRVASR